MNKFSNYYNLKHYCLGNYFYSILILQTYFTSKISYQIFKKVAIIYKYLYIINNKLHNKDISGGHI